MSLVEYYSWLKREKIYGEVPWKEVRKKKLAKLTWMNFTSISHVFIIMGGWRSYCVRKTRKTNEKHSNLFLSFRCIRDVVSSVNTILLTKDWVILSRSRHFSNQITTISLDITLALRHFTWCDFFSSLEYLFSPFRIFFGILKTS